MKNYFLALVIVLIFASGAFCTMTSAISGKTMVGNNYLIWGTFTTAANTATAITTGLNQIRACGLNEGISETIAGTVATQVICSPSGGTLYIKAAYTNTPSGTWWVIGR